MRTYVFDERMRLVVILPENAIIEKQDAKAHVVRARSFLEAKKRLYARGNL